MDHFVPRNAGGTDHPSNLYPCCLTCNSIKGSRSFEEARRLLVLHKLGWPKFTEEQLAWMRRRGFDLREYNGCELHFEANTIKQPKPAPMEPKPRHNRASVFLEGSPL